MADFEDEVPQALAADLTGWTAVVTVSTTKMDSAGYETACKFGYKTSGHFEEIFDAMLEASPPMPGGDHEKK